jgi:hypothetical protein
VSTLSGIVTLRGLELGVVSDCDCRWHDDSFDHAFGTEQCGHAEVEGIDRVELDGDLREYALRDLAATGRPHRRRLFRKWLRRIRRALALLDPETFWTDEQKDRVAEDWEPSESDYEMD